MGYLALRVALEVQEGGSLGTIGWRWTENSVVLLLGPDLIARGVGELREVVDATAAAHSAELSSPPQPPGKEHYSIDHSFDLWKHELK